MLLGHIVCMVKIAASVVLKLFMNGNEKCHTTDASQSTSETL